MRFHSAVLLFGSISGLLSLDVLAAPIRIVVVEKVAISEADAFLRSVRIGHPAGANPIPGVEDVGGQPIRLPALSTPGDGLLHFAKPALSPSSVAIPMTPDAEFNILPFPHPNFGESYEQSMIEFCHLRSQTWKARFHSISNWLREFLGLPPIRDLFNPCPSGILDIPTPVIQSAPSSTPLPFGLEKPCHSSHNAGDTFSGNALEVAGPRRRPGMWAARHRPKTFFGRLRRALYSLTPWEGRALAFVVGCGLGVLIRMVYVFIVLGARALRCRNQSSLGEEEDDEESEEVVEGVILFDAGSIKAASEEDLPLYNEKDY